MDGSFFRNPGRVYGLYAAGFVLFIVLMVILEQLGVSAATIGILFVAFTLASYAMIGFLARTMRVDVYYVAGRGVPPVHNGMATAATWISSVSFTALAGGIYFGGYHHLAFVIGLTGGFVVVNSLMAPYLRKFGCYTVPDYIGTRYGSDLVRFCAMVILVVACFTYLVAQVAAAGIIASHALRIPYQSGVWLALAGILLCSVLGGMRAVTWTQVAQYVVLIIAYLVPVVWMSNALGFGIVPQFAYGEAIQRIGALEAQYGLAPAADAIAGLAVLTVPQNDPTGGIDSWKFATLALCMAAGTASLPHLLMRSFTTPSVRAARKSAAWSLLFVFLLCFTAPALAALIKLQLLDPTLPTSLIGRPIEEVLALDWVRNWSAAGMMAAVDQNGDGVLQLNELFMRADMLVLAAPEIAGLPYAVAGLVAAGGMAAAMAAASGLLLAIANSLSHDFHYKLVDPRADTAIRLAVARILLVGTGVAAVFVVASSNPTDILGMVAWAFSFACSGLFFPLVLGIWWKRANRQGALAGMIVGFAAGGGYLLHLQTGGTPVLGLDDLRFGVAGMAASLVSMVVVTLATPAPGAEIRRMVEETRIPAGKSILAAGH